MFRKVSLLLISLTIVSFLLASCTQKTVSPEERAVARWTALINEEWEKAYSFQTPNYRKTYSSQAFRNSFGGAVDWKEVKLISVNKINKNLVDVKIEITFTFSEAGNLFIPSIFEERWQLIDDTWWHINK